MFDTWVMHEARAGCGWAWQIQQGQGQTLEFAQALLNWQLLNLVKAQYHRLKSKFQQNCIKKSLKTEAFKIQLVKDLLVILFALSPQQTKETYGRECKVRF